MNQLESTEVSAHIILPSGDINKNYDKKTEEAVFPTSPNLEKHSVSPIFHLLLVKPDSQSLSFGKVHLKLL